MSQDHDAPQLGCYVDSHHGHYAIPAAIRVARSLGFSVDPFAQWALDTYDELFHKDDFPHDALCKLCEEAEAWLNLKRAPDGALWGWNDGDFGLYAEEED